MGCRFKSSYGHYIDSLRLAIQARYSDSIQRVNNAGRGMKYVSDSFMVHPTRFWEVNPDTWRMVIAWRHEFFDADDNQIPTPFMMFFAVFFSRFHINLSSSPRS